MKTIYVSFLGAGDYRPVKYEWGNEPIDETPYAQEAELQFLLDHGMINTDRIRVLILGTPTSHKAHWERQRGYNHRSKKLGDDSGPGLKPRLQALGLHPEFIEAPEGIAAADQWETFKALLREVDEGSELIVDITHGFRAMPVVFSSALHFLRLTRNVTLKHVLYGAFETRPPQILDYADFYAIGDWTDGVSRLIEDADAGKLARLSQEGSTLKLTGFKDQELTKALVAITDAVKSVDVHGIEGKVRHALSRIDEGIKDAQKGNHTASEVLLTLIREKFSGLVMEAPLSGHYDEDYFKLQLVFIELLLEHRLFMQAFTAMREYIGSLGIRGYKPGTLKFSNSKGRGDRRMADLFVAMVSFQPWRFSGKQAHDVKKLKPYYEQLDEAGVIEDLRAFIKPLTEIRNGFDHAWTSKASVAPDVEAKGQEYLLKLRTITATALALPPLPSEPAAPSAIPPHPTRLLVLMNHTLTEAQHTSIRDYGVAPEDIIQPPEALSSAWASIPPDGDLPSELLTALADWLDAYTQPNDLLLVQGEPGATYAAVSMAFEHGLKPLYATSERRSSETIRPDGSVEKTSVFHHVQFREYKRL